MSSSGGASGPVIVVGAGIAGIQCARELRAAGVPVHVIDRGRRIGGRMGGRRIEDRQVDLGASYFTVSDDEFDEVVRTAERVGVVRPWTDTFVALEDSEATPKSGPTRWGAGNGLRAFVEHLAHDVDVQHPVTVASVTLGAAGPAVDGRTAPAVVLAMPDEQARGLLEAEPGAGLEGVVEALVRPSDPVIALAAGFERRTWDADGWFTNDSDVLDWVADDGARRGDGAAVLVAHSSAEFAVPHLEDPEAAGPGMVAALRETLDLPEPRWTHVHRWSLAKPTGEREDPYLLSEVGSGARSGLLAVCGDGWGPVSKVEGAWCSGRDLGRELVRRLT
ncbi:NAD(P)-binding protein [Nocardioidaceae bacterium]|nr:NAD(P)-binding protein [Nocardioidaceae bacterium]